MPRDILTPGAAPTDATVALAKATTTPDPAAVNADAASGAASDAISEPEATTVADDAEAPQTLADILEENQRLEALAANARLKAEIASHEASQTPTTATARPVLPTVDSVDKGSYLTEHGWIVK